MTYARRTWAQGELCDSEGSWDRCQLNGPWQWDQCEDIRVPSGRDISVDTGWQIAAVGVTQRWIYAVFVPLKTYGKTCNIRDDLWRTLKFVYVTHLTSIKLYSYSTFQTSQTTNTVIYENVGCLKENKKMYLETNAYQDNTGTIIWVIKRKMKIDNKSQYKQQWQYIY